MFKFKWRYGNGTLVERLRVQHEIDAMFIANALVHTYAQDHEADELPDNLSANTVAVMVREKLRRIGDSWNECGAWDEVDLRDTDAFRDWAGATVRRCFPRAAASDHTFNLRYPEA